MYSEAAQPSFRDIVPEDAVVEQVSTGHLFTEGPVWDPREGALLWVDITGDTIWKWIPGVGRSVFLRPSGKSNGLTFDRQGRLVAAGWSSRRIWRREHDGSIMRTRLNGRTAWCERRLLARIHRYTIDKLRQELGWSPAHSFEAGLFATVQWYIANRAWWEPLLGAHDAAVRRGLSKKSA